MVSTSSMMFSGVASGSRRWPEGRQPDSEENGRQRRRDDGVQRLQALQGGSQRRRTRREGLSDADDDCCWRSWVEDEVQRGERCERECQLSAAGG
jgi:hypothetical protein